MSKKGIIIIVIVILLALAGLGNCSGGSEYSKAGKDFNSWVKKDPNTWTDTQKEYFNDVFDFASKNSKK